jgi:hypothetical protein
MDHDVSSPTGNSRFRNLRVVEGAGSASAGEPVEQVETAAGGMSR